MEAIDTPSECPACDEINSPRNALGNQRCEASDSPDKGKEVSVPSQVEGTGMTVQDVLRGERQWFLGQGDCIELMEAMPLDSVDLVIGSPPYAEKGERYIGGAKKWKTEDWVDWMSRVTCSALRVTKGYVFWVVNGAVRQGRYLPACELLLARLYAQGVICERPCIFYKNAPPNRRDYFGNDWEYVLAFKTSEKVPNFDWESIAEPPKHSSGGRFRQRTATGERRLGSEYPQNKLARPRDVIRVTVGGGHMGSPLAHENEAPFPEKLAEYFVQPCCPPDGLVLDPFLGSGTTAHAALLHGRRCIGIDARQSQIELTRRRLEDLALRESAVAKQDISTP